MYQVKDWEKYFESNKSKVYKNKSSTIIPIKTGLGYMRLVKSENGMALYGAWCALICLLSRQRPPRQGFLTKNGKSDGEPLSIEEISLVTHAPENIILKMIELCSSKNIDWISSYKDKKRHNKGTIGAPQGHHEGTIRTPKRNVTITETKTSACAVVENEFETEYLSIVKTDHLEFVKSFPSLNVPAEYQKASTWLMANPAKRKKNNKRFIFNWLSKTQEKLDFKGVRGKPQNDKTSPALQEWYAQKDKEGE